MNKETSLYYNQNPNILKMVGFYQNNSNKLCITNHGTKYLTKLTEKNGLKKSYKG